MKRIYSIKERIIYTLSIVVLGVLSLTFMMNFSENTVMIILAYMGITFIVLALAKLFSFPYHIVVNNNRMQVFDFPLLATNKFYIKKRSLILWNGEVHLDEVKSVELVKLTAEEKIKYIGVRHLFDKYIKIGLNNSSSYKYIYVSMYSNFQIKKIITILNKIKYRT